MQHFHKISGLSVFIPEWTIQRQLSEQSFSMLNWQAAERSAVVGTWNSFYQYLCISTPLRSKLFQDLTTGGPFRVMLLLRHFHVKSVWASLSLMQTISTTFFSYVTQFTNFFLGLSLFYCYYPGCITDGKRKGLYLHNWAPPSSNSSRLRMAPLPYGGWQLRSPPYCRASPEAGVLQWWAHGKARASAR